MKRTEKILVLILLFISVKGFAQTKTFTIEDAYAKRTLYPKQMEQLQWISTGDNFSYVDLKTLIKGNTLNEKRDTVIKLSELNESVKKLGDTVINRFPAIIWLDENTFYFNENNKIYTYSLSSKSIRTVNLLNKKAENIDVSVKTLYAAYTIKNNLYVAVNGKENAVTSDTNINIVNGKSVHRDEFGITKGTFWSPKGNYLAFYRMDQTMVTDYPLVHIDNLSNRIAEEEFIKYPMAGMASHQVTVGVYDPVTYKKIFLKTGEPAEQYLTNITWSPDEKYIFIQVLNREQNHVKLNQYDASTGDYIKTLFEEKNNKYVEPLHPLYFLNTKPDQFIYQSQCDGYNHLYLYDVNGKLIKQLTKGKWVVTDFLGTDSKDTKAFYISTAVNPLERHVYSVDIKSSKIFQISSAKGTHSATISNDGKFVLDNFSSITIASEYKLEAANGMVLQTLLKNVDPLKDYKMPEMSIFTIKAKDSSDLYCRLIKPVYFDPSKKYPVIVYVYGGPHDQLISDSWLGGAGLFLNYLATKGYVVFSLDNHGSSDRGLTFEQTIFRNLGIPEVDDQMLGVNYLKKLPYIDTTHIGAYGWSYGGFMTVSMMLKQPEVFKAAVAGGPVIDWKYYEVMYGERYMDTPDENPIGYYNANMLNFVKNLKGKLLIIHGTMDNTVVWQHSLTFVKKCVDEGVQLDYFVYPEHEHNVRGKDRVHLLHKIENYFNDYLKGISKN
ncbi:MAG: DPP IV N-terminal domain-containing protein [Bacteroidales bacterium]